MLKIFTTQLHGLFKRIEEEQHEEIEDASRLLAQALIGEGSIYVIGTKEMSGIHSYLTERDDAQERIIPVTDRNCFPDIDIADRVLLISRFAHDNEAIKIAKQFQDNHVPVVSIAAFSKKHAAEELLRDYTDVMIDTKLVQGFIPTEEGTRIGFPSLMVALYAFHLIELNLADMLEDYE